MFSKSAFNIFLISLLFIGSQKLTADIVSLDANYVAGQTDVTSKLNDDRTKLTNGVNNIRGYYAGSVQTAGQIKADTIGEENCGDDMNPRIRTSEGAFCSDIVTSGLLPSTTVGTLIGSIPAGTAYPDGYRVAKTDSTAHTFTASRWTWVYLLTSGSFSYTEQVIGSSTPAAPANSAVLARVSTDTAQIANVLDLRTTNCASGPFSAIADVNGEANLGMLLSKGSPIKNSTSPGFLQGLQISYDTATTFKVKSGGAYIGGRYRIASSDITVTTAADNPTSAGSGLDTGAIGGSTRYTVYAVGDMDNAENLSISYSTSGSAPDGVTYSRKIGSIKTDAANNFVSTDVINLHSVNNDEMITTWFQVNGQTNPASITNAKNISAIADNGAGDFTVTIDRDYNDVGKMAAACTNYPNSAQEYSHFTAFTQGSIRVVTNGHGGVNADCARAMCMVVGSIERE